jgi:hypothetical protein
METTDTVGTEAEGTQQGTSQEYVELHEASDEDISAFLESADEREGKPQVAQQQAEPGEKTEQKAEEPKEEPVDPNSQVSKKDYEALLKRLDGLELLNKRRTSDLAVVKQQLRAFIEQNNNLDEQWLESPTQAYAKARQVEMAQQKLQEAEAEEQQLTNEHQAQVLLAHHIGEQLDIEAIGQSLMSDGMPEGFVASFLENPYRGALPETLIQLAKRATAEKKVRELESTLQQIVPYTQKLLEERKTAPQNVLKNVSTAMRQAPQVTASAGGTGQFGANRNVDPALMSDQELQEFLKGN